MLIVGFLTLFSMIKVWDRAFWEKPRVDHDLAPFPVSKMWAVSILALATVLLGVGVGPVFEFADNAGIALINGESP